MNSVQIAVRYTAQLLEETSEAVVEKSQLDTKRLRAQKKCVWENVKDARPMQQDIVKQTSGLNSKASTNITCSLRTSQFIGMWITPP